MAAQDPTLLGLPDGFVFLQEGETSLLGFTYSEDVKRSELMIYDGSLGLTSGAVLHDPVKTFNINGYIAGATGLAAAVVSAEIDIANATTHYGVATGAIVCNGVTRSHSPGDGAKLTITAWQRPGIAAAS